MSDDNKNQRPDPKHDRQSAEHNNAAKDSHDWVTGDEPMTGAQASYLQTLSEETGEPFDDSLTKAEASERIEELKRRDPRLKRK